MARGAAQLIGMDGRPAETRHNRGLPALPLTWRSAWRGAWRVWRAWRAWRTVDGLEALPRAVGLRAVLGALLRQHPGLPEVPHDARAARVKGVPENLQHAHGLVALHGLRAKRGAWGAGEKGRVGWEGFWKTFGGRVGFVTRGKPKSARMRVMVVRASLELRWLGAARSDA